MLAGDAEGLSRLECMQEVGEAVCQAMQAIEPDFFAKKSAQALMHKRTGQIQQ